ncbi:MAG: flagellar basal body rod protein FlgB [Deltaproteobacteria bacterium]|nr:flagellar basal body rod protein FlgB [Deltaproteobacteria bacterium]MBI3295207.1 flagellar basal body rod protein FlgB [Deltaproteobacteria bacterium]
MNTIFDKSMDVLAKTMDLSLVRHAVISDNIANAETPTFKARRVEFESELQKAVELGEGGGHAQENDISSVQPRVFEDALSERGQDLNTVDMDREMADLTKNDLKYSAATQLISRKFALLKYAITGGGQ